MLIDFLEHSCSQEWWWSASAVAVLINTKLDITRSITDALNNLKKDNRKPLAKRQYPTIIST